MLLIRNEFKVHEVLTSDRGKTGKTCALILATVGGRTSDETVVWQYAPADCWVAASGGIAGAVGAGKSIQSQEGTEGCLTKRDRKAVVSSCGACVGADGTLCRAKENIGRWNTSMRDPDHRQAIPCSDIMRACWELKRKFQLRC